MQGVASPEPLVLIVRTDPGMPVAPLLAGDTAKVLAALTGHEPLNRKPPETSVNSGDTCSPVKHRKPPVRLCPLCPADSPGPIYGLTPFTPICTSPVPLSQALRMTNHHGPDA